MGHGEPATGIEHHAEGPMARAVPDVDATPPVPRHHLGGGQAVAVAVAHGEQDMQRCHRIQEGRA